MRLTPLLLAGIVGLLTGFPDVSRAEPVPAAERLPIDMRRTTLVVRDIDNSLAFYRDALGLEVIYDAEILTPRDAKNLAEAERASRLVFLRANDDYIGVIGLLQYVKPAKPATFQGLEPFTPGSTVMVFNLDNLAPVFADAREVNRVRVLSAPRQTTYPGYASGETIAVWVSVLTDPDGFVVELNQMLK